MQNFLENMLELVPRDIKQNASKYISDDVAVFEPKEFANGKVLHLDHYHFVIFHTQPPLVRIGKKEHCFRKGSLMALEPGKELLSIPCEKRVMGSYTAISISRDFFEKLAVEVLDNDRVNFRRVENAFSPRLFGIIESFKHELMSYGCKYPGMLNSIAAQLGYQLLRDTCTDAAAAKEKHVNNFKYINRALEYMESNIAYNISIEEIAKEIYISPAHFGRVFKNHTGQTPHQYLLGLRIKKAKEMLKKDGISIEETANLCGFVSISHFSNVFKRLAGVSPSEYRKGEY